MRKTRVLFILALKYYTRTPVGLSKFDEKYCEVFLRILRTLIERLSRDKILLRSIYVNGRSHPIYVSPDAQLKYLKIGRNAFDKDLINIAEKLITKNTTTWDIGANVGIFTFAAASMASEGCVVAVEADQWLVNLLRRSARLKDYSQSNIIVVPVAISDDDSVASFFVAARGRASNALENAVGHSQMGGVRELQCVPTLTLDTLLKKLPAPDFVKMDIEGAEFMALGSASCLINEVRPLFYIETAERHGLQIVGLFQKAGYKAFSPNGKPLTEKCGNNTFFVPNDRCYSFSEAMGRV